MNKNVLIVIGGALLVAVVVAMLVQVTLGGKKQTAVQEAKVQVLVAAKDLRLGADLKDGDMLWQDWPRDGQFSGAITREDQQAPGDALKGRLACNVSKGEPLMKSSLIGEAKGNFVAAALPPGTRAVAVSVNASSMVGGFISPGDFVDVVMTYKATFETNTSDPRIQMLMDMTFRKYASETILQNLKVMAVDQAAKQPEDGKVKVAKTVTLAMTPEQAEQVALAANIGKLTLILRGVGDDVLVKKDWNVTTDSRMVTIDNEIFTEYSNIKKGAGVNSDSVRIYNGADVQSVPAN